MAKATVLRCRLDREIEQKWCALLLPLLPESAQEKIHRFRFKVDQDRALLGKLLLCFLLRDQYGIKGPLKLEYTEYQRPYLLDHPGLDFNISHSGAYVVVAL